MDDNPHRVIYATFIVRLKLLRYEGTVWDDSAHGKGVYVAEKGLVRYEGEWLHNEMEGHGVMEADIPDVQPVPGSMLETKMRKKGRIITRDFMDPEDRSWLEMDIEDTLYFVGGNREIPFYENDEWVEIYGEKPEKGRYRYAGQWKHGRMHGCGVLEVNERTIYVGRFYFGQHLEDSSGCDSDVSALHAGIAEVAAAKARMFINKPDGMVREERGPYGDPQHPYFYLDDDAWMAPGFINQFYDVPDSWKTYVEEVDQERQMWLNSFYKAPLRIPMPAELEHWWSKELDLIRKQNKLQLEELPRIEIKKLECGFLVAAGISNTGETKLPEKAGQGLIRETPSAQRNRSTSHQTSA
ncbi:hypothetical protein HPP92_011563 [Vanilla planifolia]|uniref:Uncharacterized protein n=1 Tax=Vanilla planifolia TaxID=51239 RepID=A0A835R343_VANPL|nr:hypothetical protein HPP92_011563 [Vanilla planifolia]